VKNFSHLHEFGLAILPGRLNRAEISSYDLHDRKQRSVKCLRGVKAKSLPCNWETCPLLFVSKYRTKHRICIPKSVAQIPVPVPISRALCISLEMGAKYNFPPRVKLNK